MTEFEYPEKSHVDEFTFRSVQHLLAVKGSFRFRVATGSMEPIIATGSEIEVHRLEKEASKFDIIVFWTGKILMCHYVLHVNTLPSLEGGRLYVTRGLNNNEEDWPVPSEQVLGIIKSPTLPQSYRLQIVLKRWLEKKFLNRP